MRSRSGFLFVLLIAGRAQAAHVTAVEAIALPVDNLERSVAFYTNVLTFEKVKEASANPTGGRSPDVRRASGSTSKTSPAVEI